MAIRIFTTVLISRNLSRLLRGIAGIIREGASQVASGAGQVSSSSQSLAAMVIKNLGSLFERAKGVSGGAIMGDGCISLILDIEGIISAATKSKEKDQ